MAGYITRRAEPVTSRAARPDDMAAMPTVAGMNAKPVSIGL